jgi:hypothetical protein
MRSVGGILVLAVVGVAGISAVGCGGGGGHHYGNAGGPYDGVWVVSGDYQSSVIGGTVDDAFAAIMTISESAVVGTSSLTGSFDANGNFTGTFQGTQLGTTGGPVAIQGGPATSTQFGNPAFTSLTFLASGPSASASLSFERRVSAVSPPPTTFDGYYSGAWGDVAALNASGGGGQSLAGGVYFQILNGVVTSQDNSAGFFISGSVDATGFFTGSITDADGTFNISGQIDTSENGFALLGNEPGFTIQTLVAYRL